jgi:hypothetical protein
MNKSKKGKKCDKIKSDLIKGKQYFTHKSEKLIIEKSKLIFDCCCKTKYSNLLTENHKIEVFNRYYALKSH